MENKRHAEKVVATPEWVTAGRSDRATIETVAGGWQSSAAPLARGRSFTDWKNKVISVPEGDGAVARGVRYHELIHTLASPASVPLSLFDHLGLSHTAIEVAEEMRVNAIGLSGDGEIAKSIYELSDGTEQGGADFAVEHNDWQNAVALMTATYGTKSFRDVKRRLRKNPEWANSVLGVEAVLKRMNKDLVLGRASQTLPQKCEWADSKGKISSAVLPSDYVNATLPLAQAVQQMMTTPPTPENKNKLPREVFEGLSPKDGKINWQIMKMGMSRLTQPSATFIGKKKFASVTGKTIKHPERMFTDPERRLFSRTLKSTGGVVVVDCSGSMGLSNDELSAILKAAPGCTVIGYSTGSRAKHNAFILAKGGRRVAETELYKILRGFGGGNGIDLPVLVWANQNRKSKKDFLLWISDGWVTGEGDEHSPALAMECVNFLIKNRGVNARNPDEGIALLENLKRGKPLPRYLLCDFLNDLKKQTERDKTK